MKYDMDLILSPEETFDEKRIISKASSKLGINKDKIDGFKILKKSIDARRKDIKINLRIRVYVGEEVKETYQKISFPFVGDRPKVIVVGAGPAGLFASLELMEHNLCPIILERGKNVHERKLDCAKLSREGILNENSNYCYGEGGAGAYSDGKLFTRSTKKGDTKKVLSLLAQFGSGEEVLYEAHPHIGSDKLPLVIENIRNEIISKGGEVHFNTLVTSLLIKDGRVIGVDSDKGEFLGPVILATGHSAKDVYHFLYDSGIDLEAKETAVGVRVEHPQALIDIMQYHTKEGRGKYLPPAEYSFVTQVNNRGVYSFCMCPGGMIVPSQTENGLQVVNGMSASKRGGEKANAAFVVQIKKEDVVDKGVFSILDYVEEIERKSYLPHFVAPSQRMVDFVNNKVSSTLPKTTYAPGVESINLSSTLPHLVSSSLREGFLDFGRMSRGLFLTNDALLIASETRTSSPVRILRDDTRRESIPGLFPAGEGSGYAGGIVSAAIDGEESAKALASLYFNEVI